MRPSRRRGFTLLEVLVVIAIIGVLVALLLPAVQAAREQVRRRSCGNNLGQLILAIHNYESLHGVYPPGTIDAKGPILNAQLGYHHNWLIQILPFLEDRALWEGIDKRVGVYHPKQVPLLAVPPRLIDCPSCMAPQGNPCYAGVHNDTEKPIDAMDNGVFFLNSKLRIEDVSDGLAHTLFLGEKIPDGWDLHWMSGTRVTLRNTGSGINALKYRVDLPQAQDRRYGSSSYVSYDYSELDQAVGAVVGEDMEATETEPAFPKLALAPAVAPGGPGNPLWVGSFGSFHSGGANFAFGDGSIRYLRDTMQLSQLQQMAHRKDGQLPPRLSER